MKARSNASVGGIRVYILDCQNAEWNLGLNPHTGHHDDRL